MIRSLFLLHRWLGIAIGIIMLLWTLSGIVMMYKQFPELNQQESLGLLQALDFDDCCTLPADELRTSDQLANAQVEMLQGRPVLRVRDQSRQLHSYDLNSGGVIESVSSPAAHSIAREFAGQQFSSKTIDSLGSIQIDQWTVYGSYNPHRPLYKFAVGDAANSEFYISSRTGEVVQLTTREQRVWSYLGAVTHWLYPTMLRQHTGLWAQVVIWLSIGGIFLTVTGLYVGIRQFKRRRSGRRSPYRGFALYHHYTGLTFGIVTLTWIASGLLSMNPWGLLQGESAAPEVERLSARTLNWSDLELALPRLDRGGFPNDTVRVEVGVTGGSAALFTHGQGGVRHRYNPRTMRLDALGEEELHQLAGQLQPESQIASAEIIDHADAYYYEHHVPREFPVYRVMFDDKQARRYYLSPLSGELLQKVDGNRQLYRWLFYGLHRGDFTAFLRSRPVWDSFMLLFLFGVTLVCATGSYLGLKRVRRNFASRARLQKFNENRAEQPPRGKQR